MSHDGINSAVEGTSKAAIDGSQCNSTAEKATKPPIAAVLNGGRDTNPTTEETPETTHPKMTGSKAMKTMISKQLGQGQDAGLGQDTR